MITAKFDRPLCGGRCQTIQLWHKLRHHFFTAQGGQWWWRSVGGFVIMDMRHPFRHILVHLAVGSQRRQLGNYNNKKSKTSRELALM